MKPWITAQNLRRSLLRGGVAGLCLAAPFLLFGGSWVDAWTGFLVGLAYFGGPAWAEFLLERAETSTYRQRLGAFGLAALLALGGLIAVWAQSVYSGSLARAGDWRQALAAVQRQVIANNPAEWVTLAQLACLAGLSSHTRVTRRPSEQLTLAFLCVGAALITLGAQIPLSDPWDWLSFLFIGFGMTLLGGVIVWALAEWMAGYARLIDRLERWLFG